MDQPEALSGFLLHRQQQHQLRLAMTARSSSETRLRTPGAPTRYPDGEAAKRCASQPPFTTDDDLQALLKSLGM